MEIGWADVADERRRLADELAAADIDPVAWDGPSLCEGWRARDVLGHLVWLAEATLVGGMLDSFRQLRLPNGSINKIALREGKADPDELIARLRAGADGRFVVPTLGPQTALGEVVTHRADLSGAVGLADRPADARTEAVLQQYVKLHRVFGQSGKVAALRAVATDGPCAVGPEDAPEVRGPGDELLRAFAGRKAGIDRLEGPGREVLLRS